jgi:predicted MFS family arabinose efflux permease
MHWLAWFFALLFFAFQFVLRLLPGLVMQDVMAKFQLNASAYGFLSSMYYVGYAGMQIPVAILLDRFGPRRVISFFAALCAAATLLFATTESWPMLVAARFFVGFGSAAGFLGCSKIVSEAFPRKSYSKMIGLTFTFGLIGALYGGKPTSMLISQVGWQQAALAIGCAGLVIAALVYIFVRDNKNNENNVAKHAPTPSIIATLKTIVSSKALLLMALANLLMVGSLEGFADVWGVSYLTQTHGFEQALSASITSCIFIGMLFGGPLLAAIAERFGALLQTIAACGLITAAIFVVMLLSGTALSHIALCALMLIVGILCCYQVLVFAAGSERVPPAMAGVTVAFLNCVNMLGGTFFHSTIGTLLDHFWSGHTNADGLKIYVAADYTLALGAIPVCSLLGAIIFWYVGRARKTIE